jgi:cytochrome c-type biogenesis protein CcmH/NrfF
VTSRKDRQENIREDNSKIMILALLIAIIIIIILVLVFVLRKKRSTSTSDIQDLDQTMTTPQEGQVQTIEPVSEINIQELEPEQGPGREQILDTTEPMEDSMEQTGESGESGEFREFGESNESIEREVVDQEPIQAPEQAELDASTIPAETPPLAVPVSPALETDQVPESNDMPSTLSEENPEDEAETNEIQQPQTQQIPCPICQNEITIYTSPCQHCGSELNWS